MKHTIWEINKKTKVPKMLFETDDDEQLKQKIIDLVGSDKIYAIRINS